MALARRHRLHELACFTLLVRSGQIRRGDPKMITGAHFLLYSTDPEADRAFFRDVLRFASIDVGGGWLIFRLPPAEIGVHPAGGEFVQPHAGHALAGTVMYLMCDDLAATLSSLDASGVACGEVQEADWGRSSTLRLPSGAEIGLYQPAHPTALELG
jgi:predicted enzyme related to lactoylglutathione lyase